MTTDEAVDAFERGVLPPAQFSHRVHLAAGWAALARHGFPDGVVRFRAQLRAYVAAAGAAAKYHETLTWAYMILMNEERELHAAPSESFAEMIARRPDLLDHRGGAIARVYAPHELASDAARRTLILPRAR